MPTLATGERDFGKPEVEHDCGGGTGGGGGGNGCSDGGVGGAATISGGPGGRGRGLPPPTVTSTCTIPGVVRRGIRSLSTAIATTELGSTSVRLPISRAVVRHAALDSR